MLKVDRYGVDNSRVMECQDLKLQEQRPFMVVPTYDDSPVFQFHKPPHHSHVPQDPDPSCLVVS